MTPSNSDPTALPHLGLSQAHFQADSNGSLLDDCAEQGNSEEFSYDPVPPKKTVLVSVRYRLGGRGQPLPYPLDESDGE